MRISIEWHLVSYIPIKYVSAYHNAMAGVPGRRSEEPESLLRDSSHPKAVRRRSSRRGRNEANRGGNLDENPHPSVIISPPHEPLESAPRIPIPTLLPKEPGFIDGADYIPFVDSQDEYDPDASSIPNPKKRKLDAREREDMDVTKQERGGDRGKDHLDTPWMWYLKVDPSDSVSAM